MMMPDFLHSAIALAQAMLALALVFVLLRLLLGPRAEDRVLALDALYVDAMLLILTYGMRQGDPVYFEAALAIAVLGFVATAALAKFLLRGEVIE